MISVVSDSHHGEHSAYRVSRSVVERVWGVCMAR
jgi:hypothetical protein